MGQCFKTLTPQEKEAVKSTVNIDKNIQASKEAEAKVFKLLLLGTGESGKSTIFKQMQILYQDGFNEYEKITYRLVLRRNVVESIQTLITGAARFGYRLSSPAADAAAKYLLEVDPLSAEFWTEDIVKHVSVLWKKEDAITQAFQSRSRLQLPDSAEYLLNDLARIGAANYTPTRDDILRARLRTSGIVEKLFRTNNTDFKLLDVGGQRNERRKWMHCFEGVTAVIFVTAISEYDQQLYEDEKVNRLHESISVFDQICNNPYFTKTSMILFLNKIDIFQTKIHQVPLTTCFPDYAGDNSFEEASNYIRDRFVEVNRQTKDIFPHLTCATDTNNVERVFEACKKIILKKSLDKLGLT